jgi:hypothetical protein
MFPCFHRLSVQRLCQRYILMVNILLQLINYLNPCYFENCSSTPEKHFETGNSQNEKKCRCIFWSETNVIYVDILI